MALEDILIRPFRDGEVAIVRDLFIDVNRSLAPPDMREAFEVYIQRSLDEEMNRVAHYHAEKGADSGSLSTALI